MEKAKKNLEESIYSRLKNIAKQKKRPVQEILKYYAMERFLYRLGVSSYQNSFYLKGGLMLMVWNSMTHRATVDIDLLAKTANSIVELQSRFLLRLFWKPFMATQLKKIGGMLFCEIFPMSLYPWKRLSEI